MIGTGIQEPRKHSYFHFFILSYKSHFNKVLITACGKNLTHFNIIFIKAHGKNLSHFNNVSIAACGKKALTSGSPGSRTGSSTTRSSGTSSLQGGRFCPSLARISRIYNSDLLCFVLCIFTREEEMFDKKFEDLQLPTSRLVRRRRHLGRVYEQVTLIMVSSF